MCINLMKERLLLNKEIYILIENKKRGTDRFLFYVID